MTIRCLTGRALAEAIGEQLDCSNSSGSLQGREVQGCDYSDRGQLSGDDDLARFDADRAAITYVVFSYATPIAWVARGKVYKVQARFSRTTTTHQKALYLLRATP